MQVSFSGGGLRVFSDVFVFASAVSEVASGPDCVIVSYLKFRLNLGVVVVARRFVAPPVGRHFLRR